MCTIACPAPLGLGIIPQFPLAEDENRLLNYLEAARLPKCINYFSKESGHVASVESAAIMY